jgi:hypothetical protein
MNESTINKINKCLDEAIQEASKPINDELDRVICNLDEQMTTLEELEIKIGQVVVSIDDLRGMIACRKNWPVGGKGLCD